MLFNDLLCADKDVKSNQNIFNVFVRYWHKDTRSVKDILGRISFQRTLWLCELSWYGTIRVANSAQSNNVLCLYIRPCLLKYLLCNAKAYMRNLWTCIIYLLLRFFSCFTIYGIIAKKYIYWNDADHQRTLNEKANSINAFLYYWITVLNHI